LNSRSLTAERPKSSKKSTRKESKKAAYRRVQSCPSKLDNKEEGKAPSSAEDSDVLFSSSELDSSGLEDEEPNMSTRKTSRRNFHLSAIDLLTRRLLIAASRTGNGGDAYFVV
jgi:hypothetical protein